MAWWRRFLTGRDGDLGGLRDPRPDDPQAPTPRHRTILSLNGGGLRGLISLGLLTRLEEAYGGGPLARHVDLIGGTSTGAVIATGLALELPIEEMRRAYTEIAPAAFRRSYWRLPGLHALFDAAPMNTYIESVCGDRTLASGDLRTGLALLLKRLDTDEIWTVTNNPDAPFWQEPGDGSFVANRDYRLSDLIRAATAAPHYFDPEPIEVGGDAQGIFIDAGVTPYNNPALMLFHLIASAQHGYSWPLGADHLRIISVGTGGYRHRQDPERLLNMSSSGLALSALLSSVRHGGKMISRELKYLGRDMRTGHATLAQPLYETLRLDVTLESDWLAAELGMRVSKADVAQLRRLDNTQMLDLAFEIGLRAGERLIDDHVVAALAEGQTPAQV